MRVPPFVTEVVLPAALMVLAVAFGFFLDWLNYCYPHRHAWHPAVNARVTSPAVTRQTP